MAKSKKKKPVKAKSNGKPAAAVPACILSGSFHLTGSGLRVEGKPTFDQWSNAVYELKSLGRCLMWAIGDLLVYGEDQWNEDYAQVLDSADYADESVKVAKWVAKAFPPERRVSGLTFKHHKEVAALTAKQADKLLIQASEEGLSTRDLHLKAQEIKADGSEQVTRVTLKTPEKPAVREAESAKTEPAETEPEEKPEPTPEPPADPGKEFVSAVETLCRDIDQIAARMKTLRESPFSYSIHVDSAVAQVEAARKTLWQGRPAHMCPYCKGDGCTACKKTGRVKRSTSDAGKEAVG